MIASLYKYSRHDLYYLYNTYGAKVEEALASLNSLTHLSAGELGELLAVDYKPIEPLQAYYTKAFAKVEEKFMKYAKALFAVFLYYEGRCKHENKFYFYCHFTIINNEATRKAPVDERFIKFLINLDQITRMYRTFAVTTE